MQIVANKHPHKLSSKFVLTVTDGDSKRTAETQPTNADQRKKAAKALQVPLEWVERACQEPGTNLTIPSVDGSTNTDFEFTIRRIDAKEGDTFVYNRTCFVDAMKQQSPDGCMLATWPKDAALCCLDVDINPDFPDGLVDIGSYVRLIAPRPFAWFRSRSGGMHLFYDGPLAYEYASVAAVWLHQNGKGLWKRLELKHDSRLPPPSESLDTQEPSDDIALIQSWMRDGELPILIIKTWLDEKGMEQGCRYEHERCVIDSGPSSGGTPVVVLDRGIFCHECEGKRGDGFRSWERLIQNRGFNIIRTLVRNQTHWEHARYVLSSLYELPEAILRQVYSLLIRTSPNGVANLQRVFRAGIGVVRYADRWGTTDGSTLRITHAQAILSELPAVKCAADLNRFSQAIDLTEYGYPALRIVRGLRIYGHQLKYEDPSPTIVHAKDPAPQYLPVEARMTSDQIDNAFWQFFPNLNMTYLRALIVARGVVESNVGRLPMFIVSGVSGSGKTITVQIAAAVCGDVCTEVQWQKDQQRWGQAILNACQQGSFATIDEPFKLAGKEKLPPERALEVALNLTRGTTTHQLYVGPVKYETVPVCVFTDIKIPPAVMMHAQIGRRMHHIHLTTRVDWHKHLGTTAAVGKELHMIRTFNEEMRRACDSLVSEIIDQWFGNEQLSFDSMMEKLEVKRLEQIADEDVAPRATFKRFADLLMAAPNATGIDAKRFPGPGWKVIRKLDCDADATDPESLAGLYAQFYDYSDFGSSERLQERDWGDILERPGADIRLQIRGSKNAVAALRFYCKGKINLEIFK